MSELGVCPVCSGKVSTSASFCPHCGERELDVITDAGFTKCPRCNGSCRYCSWGNVATQELLDRRTGKRYRRTRSAYTCDPPDGEWEKEWRLIRDSDSTESDHSSSKSYSVGHSSSRAPASRSWDKQYELLEAFGEVLFHISYVYLLPTFTMMTMAFMYGYSNKFRDQQMMTYAPVANWLGVAFNALSPGYTVKGDGIIGVLVTWAVALGTVCWFCVWFGERKSK